MSGFGLEEIDIPGRDYLKEALTSCTDPLKAIEDFQVIALHVMYKYKYIHLNLETCTSNYNVCDHSLL